MENYHSVYSQKFSSIKELRKKRDRLRGFQMEKKKPFIDEVDFNYHPLPVFYSSFEDLNAESVVKLSANFYCLEKFWKIEFFVLMNEDKRLIYLFPHYMAVCHEPNNMKNWENVFFNINPVSYKKDMNKLMDNTSLFVESAFEDIASEKMDGGKNLESFKGYMNNLIERIEEAFIEWME